MPRPVYMLCAESGSEDRRTGLISHFKVLEQVHVRRLPEVPTGQILVVQSLQFQVVTVWEKEESDASTQDFEYRFVLRLPPDGEEVVAQSGTIRFDNRRYRLILETGGNLFQAVGLFQVECRLRPVGATDDAWIVQRYSFPVIDPEAQTTDGQTP
jgi:hypothetical protein